MMPSGRATSARKRSMSFASIAPLSMITRFVLRMNRALLARLL
jgi:hypothetical protein